jgi:hypothetical protein
MNLPTVLTWQLSSLVSGQMLLASPLPPLVSMEEATIKVIPE